MFPWVTGELALLFCCFLEAQDSRWLSLLSVLPISLFCQLTKKTSERVPRAGIWTFLKMAWFCLITVMSQGKHRPKLTPKWVSVGSVQGTQTLSELGPSSIGHSHVEALIWNMEPTRPLCRVTAAIFAEY